MLLLSYSTSDNTQIH